MGTDDVVRDALAEEERQKQARRAAKQEEGR
jgi:hypothetical protein